VQLPRFTDFFVSAEDCGTSSLFPPLSHTGNQRPKAVLSSANLSATR
jgi:hypothetical protein